MPWCRGCEAEFREGVDRCPNCDLPLVEELSPAPRPPSDVLQRVGRQPAWTLTYVAQAAGLLRRQRHLFTIPLIIAAINLALVVGGYPSLSRRVLGPSAWQQMRATADAQHRDPAARAMLTRQAVQQAARQMGWSALHAEAMPLQGVSASTGVALVTGGRAITPVERLLYEAFGLAVSLLTIAGLYGMVAAAVEGRPRPRFWAETRRLFWPMLGCSALVFGVWWGLGQLEMLVLTRSRWVPPLATMLVTSLALLPLGLALIGITRGQGIREALGGSLAILRREWGVALSLVLLLLLPTLAIELVRDLLRVALPHGGFSVAEQAALTGWQQITRGLLGLWVCAAEFLWWDGARRRMAEKTATKVPVG